MMEGQQGDTCDAMGAVMGAHGYTPSPRIEPTVRVSVEIRATSSFAGALTAAMEGHRVTRHGWNAGGQYVAMQVADKHSKLSLPYLYLKNAQNELVPWAPTQGDLFAHDWAILPR